MFLLLIALVAVTVGPFAVAWFVSQRRFVAALKLQEPTLPGEAWHYFSRLGEAYDRSQADPELERLRRTHNVRFIVLIAVLFAAPFVWFLVLRTLERLGVDVSGDGPAAGPRAIDLLIGAVIVTIVGFWAVELIRTRRGRDRFPLLISLLGIGIAVAVGVILLGSRLS